MIYIVEDDEGIQEVYEGAFEGLYDVEIFGDAKSFFAALEDRRPSLAILDIMLPDTDGYTILTELRKHDERLPVIIVSAKSDEISFVKGLNKGADDYMSKPFSVMELIARVKANIRKSAMGGGEIISIGEITINNSEHEVTVAGHHVQLTLKEYKLLKLLMEKCNNVVTREKILNAVWDYDYVGETRTLDMHIKSLRSKIAQFTPVQYIHTVRGVGYKFSK